jgi:hypothetical protein
MIDQTIDLNHNSAQCIQTASHFGSTVYYNICDGTQHVVAWGGVDWVGTALLFGVGIAIIILILGLFLMMICDF